MQKILLIISFMVLISDVSGNVGSGRLWKNYTDLIGEVLQKGRMRSTRNRRACMTRCMNVDDAKGVVLPANTRGPPRGNGKILGELLEKAKKKFASIFKLNGKEPETNAEVKELYSDLSVNDNKCKQPTDKPGPKKMSLCAYNKLIEYFLKHGVQVVYPSENSANEPNLRSQYFY